MTTSQVHPRVLLDWTHATSLLTVRRLFPALLAFGLPAAALAVFLAVETKTMLAPLLVIGITALVLGIAVLVIAAIGPHTARFVLTTIGIEERAVSQAYSTVSALASIAEPALSEKMDRDIRWRRVRWVKINARHCEIRVRSWADAKPIVLHCDPDFFARVREIVERYAPRKT